MSFFFSSNLWSAYQWLKHLCNRKHPHTSGLCATFEFPPRVSRRSLSTFSHSTASWACEGKTASLSWKLDHWEKNYSSRIQYTTNFDPMPEWNWVIATQAPHRSKKQEERWWLSKLFQASGSGQGRRTQLWEEGGASGGTGLRNYLDLAPDCLTFDT